MSVIRMSVDSQYLPAIVTLPAGARSGADASTAGQPALRLVRADVMRQAAEHHIDAVDLRLRYEGAIEVEQRKHGRTGLPGKRTRTELRQFDTWVARQEVDKGHPGVAVSPGDSSLYRLAHERMSIQGDCINIRA